MFDKSSHPLPSIFSIGEKIVGPGQPALIVAEVGQAHDGSLGTAHAYIDAAADAGADGVKFQTHIAAAESTPGEPFRVKFSPQDETRYDYWKRMEFTEPQWHGLAKHAAERGLLFLSSAFSLEAVELLQRVGVPAWKVGAGEITTLPMLDAMARTGKPLLLSSGMSPWSDLDEAVQVAARHRAPVAVFQCTTSYPCPPERLGLNVLAELRERYGCPVGLSDHSGAIYAGLAAVTLGANLLEVHITFSRKCFGPDVPASLTPEELKQLVDGTRFIQQAMNHPVDKELLAGEMGDLRKMFGKSLVAARDLPPGHRLEEIDLAMRKPGTGIPARDLPALVGRILKRAVTANTLLSQDDFE